MKEKLPKQLTKTQSAGSKNKLNQVFRSMTALTAALIATKSNDAQVVYHDINPDIILLTTQSYELDLNNDGTTDFKFKIKNSSGENDEKIYGMNSNDEVAGNALVKAFENGSSISAGNFVTDNSILFETFGFGSHIGEWVNLTNGYAGVRIVDQAAWHYAWIRMDVTQNPMRMVIKDYGYNETPNEGIFADVETLNAGIPVSIYSSESIVYVEVPPTIADARACIYNLLGEKVYERELAIGKNQVNLSPLLKGVYLVHVDGSKISYSKKIELK